MPSEQEPLDYYYYFGPEQLSGIHVEETRKKGHCILSALEYISHGQIQLSEGIKKWCNQYCDVFKLECISSLSDAPIQHLNWSSTTTYHSICI